MSQPTVAELEFKRVQESDRFNDLRNSHRRFVIPMAVIFLLWYIAYVVVAAFAPQVMSIKVLGNINLGIIWGLLQFVTTFAITMAYVSFANRKIDPVATDIREELEAQGIGLPEETIDDTDEAVVVEELTQPQGDH